MTTRSDIALQDDPDRAVDGRAARRERNRLAAVDAAIELFSEGNLQPELDEIALRCGLSSKSVHRYFDNSNALLSAAIRRQLELGYLLYHLRAIGQGPLENRLDCFVAKRLEAHQVIGATARAATVLALKNAAVRENMDRVRRLLRDQIELQFARELDALPAGQRKSRVAAIDVLVQFESLDYYRLRRELNFGETHTMIIEALRKLLEPKSIDLKLTGNAR